MVKVRGHQIWYTTYFHQMIYLQTKYQKPMSKDKKSYGQTNFIYEEEKNSHKNNDSLLEKRRHKNTEKMIKS